MKTPTGSTRGFCAGLSTVLLTLLSTLLPQLTAAPLGTAFTYQGRLSTGGNAANGTYDFQFKLFDALTGGVQQGSTVTVAAVAATNGLFMVPVDFGNAFTGSALWIEVATSTNGAGSFTTLAPRQVLTATPYASYAPSAGAAATASTATAAQGVTANAVTGAGIASGQVVKSLNGLKDAVALAAGPNVSFVTNANTLTISAAGGGASGGWTTTGNAGTTPAANFLGTTDGQPLVLKAGNVGINTNNPQATLHVNGTVLANHFMGEGAGLTNIAATMAVPFTLTRLASTNNGGSARGVAVSGRYAGLANGYDGLRVYDLTDPAHPVNVSHDTDFAWDAAAVALSGHYAFVASDKLYCVDISSPANPVTVGSSAGSYYGAGVAVSGNTAYVAADTDGLFTYNVANPTNPASLGHIDNGGSAQGVAVSGNFAYLANDTDGLRIYNVANPAAPVNIARIYNNPTRVRGVAVSGNFAYLANDSDGLRIYNVANPTNPVSVSQTFDAGYAYGVTVTGNYAFVANFNDGLRVYDVSDPAHPRSVGVSPPSGDSAPQAVAVSGNYAYTADALGGLSTYFAAPLATVTGVVGATGFLGDGSSLTNLNAGQLTGQIPSALLGGVWQLGGNAGTKLGASFLGTTDHQPLELRVNNQPALRLGTDGSVALGQSTVASAPGAVAFGAHTTASGTNSMAAGTYTIASGNYSTALGRGTSADGEESVAMGLSTVASGFYSTALGYESTASGYGSVAMGALNSAAGTLSFALGQRAKANHDGTFVWSDIYGSEDFASTADYQFLIRAHGGVGIGTNVPQAALHVLADTNFFHTAIRGEVSEGKGVSGFASSGTGVSGDTLSGTGVSGSSFGGTGVSGSSFGGTGVSGGAFGGDGVSGSSLFGTGVRGSSLTFVGVWGESTNVGIIAMNTTTSSSPEALLASASYAGEFIGDVKVHGNLSKSGGSFKIDHPLDPANKYLSHSFVESPDMKNIYDGVATLDEHGEAVVELPAWFEALNKDFRYQLTAIGAPGPNLYIAQKISKNRFKIAGGTPSGEVSWQVTGTRQDAWANAHRIVVEETKPASERGTYLAPEVLGKPREQGVNWIERSKMMESLKKRSGPVTEKHPGVAQ